MKTMTKKTYLAPTVNMFRIEGQSILAGSLNPEDANPTVVVTDETMENGFFSSRGLGWEDED